MPRSRVLSFMSTWSSGLPRSPTTDSHKFDPPSAPPQTPKKLAVDTTPSSAAQVFSQSVKDSPSPTTQQRFRSDSRPSRPSSMIQTYQPPFMDVAHDTLPELQPIFTFLNSHSNKLYQEGYFLKLHDLDSRGRPSPDRVWNECFAQLVGTVLSLWDAAALDAAGEDGEVVPTFINLSDASIKMIESLPMNGSAGGTLQNVLSISTAANNRYLFHFNSLNSLTQWTAGIRLSMYEHATLQEAYTGSLIAGKGKLLNNIRVILERSRFKTEDWARVRFGAGTPWRRCWFVISPPDEKQYKKAQNSLKKRDAYDRKVRVPKGDIKIYDTRKITKKTRPIATITDAYAAYAIYPQSKPLIDQSTLVKIEGLITIHSSPETKSEGFVFIMPEVHPAVTGFEMMLRFLFPVYDTFALYGRPSRLIADVLDQRGLMFAMPRDRRYGYLDILDVSGLIHTDGSSTWSERQWRVEMKKLTSHRMTSGEAPRGMSASRGNLTSRTSLSLNRGAVRFSEDSAHSTPVSRRGSPPQANDNLQFAPPRRVDTAPMGPVGGGSPARTHNRSASEAMDYRRYLSDTPSRLSYEASADESDYPPPPPPAHAAAYHERNGTDTPENVFSDSESPPTDTDTVYEELRMKSASPLPAPVASPPGFVHNPSARPARQPYQPPALRDANTSMDPATLHQLADATSRAAPGGPEHYSSLDASSGRLAAGHNQRERLPTIPASPFVRDTPSHGQDQDVNDYGPPVPRHGYFPQYDGVPDRTNVASPPPGPGVMRKPVPNRVQSPERQPVRPSSPVSLGSLRGELMEQAVLERMLAENTGSIAGMSDDYDDDAAAATADDSTDYASTKASSPKKPAGDRPRAGKLKTVGNPELPQEEPSRFDLQSNDDIHIEPSEIPQVDFGPTLIYKPTGRPTTSGSGNSPAEFVKPESAQRSSSRLSMLDSKREDASQANPRSVPWQPAMMPVEDDMKRKSLTPEQWVQYRASAGRPKAQSRAIPVYGHSHSRQQSSATLARQMSKTPPLSRTPSGDWTQQSGRTSKTPPLSRTPSGDWSQQARMASKTPPLSRTPSGDWTQYMQGGSRSQSRLSGAYLQAQSPGAPLQTNQAQQLTAREQMTVARATGGPLVSLSQRDRKQGREVEEAPGLIGALAAREREKAAVRQGHQSAMVQQAILARQQQQQQQAEMEAQMQRQYQMQQLAQQQAQAQAQAQAYHFQQQVYQNPMAGQVPQMSPNYTYTPQQQQLQQQRASSYFGQGSQVDVGMYSGMQGQGQGQEYVQGYNGAVPAQQAYIPGQAHMQAGQQPRRYYR